MNVKRDPVTDLGAKRWNSKRSFVPVPGAPGYKVSKQGAVIGKSGRLLKARPRTPSRTGNIPYLAVAVFANGSRKERYVHHLVLEAFVGPRPEHMEARHLDGDHANNRLDNLSWGTKEENGKDKIRHNPDCRKCGKPLSGDNLLMVKTRKGSDYRARKCRSCTKAAQAVAYQRRKNSDA